MEVLKGYPPELEWALIAIGVLLVAVTAQAAALVRDGRATEAWLRAPRWLGAAALLFATFGFVLGADYWVSRTARFAGDVDIGHMHAGALLFFFGTVLAAAGLVASFVLERWAERWEAGK
jgi:hypothetical protein